MVLTWDDLWGKLWMVKTGCHASHMPSDDLASLLWPPGWPPLDPLRTGGSLFVSKLERKVVTSDALRPWEKGIGILFWLVDFKGIGTLPPKKTGKKEVTHRASRSQTVCTEAKGEETNPIYQSVGRALAGQGGDWPSEPLPEPKTDFDTLAKGEKEGESHTSLSSP